jgi:hypothetical protein
MNKHVYNASIMAGITLCSVGAGLAYLPAGLIVGGVLVLALTVSGARMAGGRG